MSIIVAQNYVARVLVIELVDLVLAGQYGNVPAQEVDEDSLAGSEHGTQQGSVRLAVGLVYSDHDGDAPKPKCSVKDQRKSRCQLPPEMGVSPWLDIPECQRPVIKGQGDQQLPFVDPIALASHLDVLGHSVAGYAQNGRDLGIAFALGHKQYALALPVGQNRYAAYETFASFQPEPPCAFKGEDTGAVRKKRDGASGPRRTAGKRAGPACFARNMGRDGKTVAQALLAPQGKDLAIDSRQWNEPGQFRPEKALRGYVACAVHRIDCPERLSVVAFSPAVGIIVQPEYTIPITRLVDVMGQRKIVETQRRGHFGKQRVKIDDTFHLVRNVFEKFLQRTIRHEVPLRPPAEPAAGFQQGALSPANGSQSDFSGPHATRLTLRQTYHDRAALQCGISLKWNRLLAHSVACSRQDGGAGGGGDLAAAACEAG